MNTLPCELLEHICFNLDNASLVNFLSTDKNNNNIDNKYFWKRKCINEYNVKFNKKIKNWKYKYTQLYKNNCVHCCKKTKIFNEFFNEKVCRNCEKAIPKYECISYTKANREYFLTKKDLSNIKFINRNNRFNSKYPLKLYLKNDILDYIKNRYGYYYYNDLKNNKINDLKNRRIAFLSKFNILNTMLVMQYNINIVNITPEINKYSKNLYIRYLKTIKDHGSNLDVQRLFEYCIELDFIIKFTDLDWSKFNDFDSLLTYYILTTKDIIPLHVNDYIDLKISSTMSKYKCELKRKHKVLIDLPNESLSNPVIYNYIRDNKSNVKSIDCVLTLEIFLIEYADLNNFLMYNMINNIKIDKSNLYLRLLNKWYYYNKDNTFAIPSKIYKFLLD